MSIVTKFKNSQTRGIPQWQSNKMKRIIINRWQEVWEIVEARKTSKS